MQSRLSKFRRQVKLVSLISLGVLSACYVSEVSAVRVSLTFRGTVVGDPFLPSGYPPESGVVPGMPVEGEVWWNDEEPVDRSETVGPGESVYIWGNSPGPAHGFGVKIGRHTMVSDPWNLQMVVVNQSPGTPSGFIPADRVKLEYVGRGGECTNDPQHSPSSCQFVFELLVDPSALANSAIPSSPLPFLHPLPIGTWQGAAFWDNPPLEVLYLSNSS